MKSTVSALLLSAAFTSASCVELEEREVLSCALDGGSLERMDAGGPVQPEAGAVLVSDVVEPGGCGRWRSTHFADRPPTDAESYGLEANSLGTWQQYVCRFKDEVDGRPVVLQGKGVFGWSCYAVMPVTTTTPIRVRASDHFEVLVGSKDCARMVPFDPALRLLPTGVDADGGRTYTCRGIVNSVDVPGQSMPLGRFDPVRKSCVFEWHQSVREAPRLEGEQFEVLALP